MKSIAVAIVLSVSPADSTGPMEQIEIGKTVVRNHKEFAGEWRDCLDTAKIIETRPLGRGISSTGLKAFCKVEKVNEK